jgi:hypothetical protein
MKCALLILTVVLTAALNSVGQARPEPRLVDEFGQQSCCCELGGRIDVFMSELNANPGSVGYIILADSKTQSQLFREKYFDGYSQMRGFDESRIVIVRKPGFNDPQSTQLWIVPPGAEIEGDYLPDSEYLIPGNKRRALFFSGFFDDADLCYTGPPFRVLAKYLKADPQLTANIAVASKNDRIYREAVEKTIERFRTNYQTDPKRLRFYHVRKNIETPEYEIWLVRRSVGRDSPMVLKTAVSK